MTAEVRELAAKRRYVQPGVVALVLNTAEPSMVFMFDIERHGRPAVLCFNWRRASLVVYWGVFVQGVFGLIALSLALSLWTAKRVSRPLQDLRAQVLKIASGDLALRLPEAGEDEVADVSRAVNCLTDNLSRHMAGFKQLMANMSHEMRTAVANLSMSLETMAEIGPKSAGEPPDAESEARLADHLAQARLEVELLENMVASGLLGGKLDLRHEELEAAPLDFSSLCRQVARRHDFRAALKNVAWRSDIAPDLWLVGDEILLDRLLSNIFDNAFKYTEKSGEINFYLKADDEYLIIICQNTYKLLTEEQIKSLCLPYYRLEQGQIYGTGLGLYLVHKIVELHNGLIDISNYDCGLKFTVKLPLSQRQAEK
ncbi:MAG: HAMP domain-containing histidine kinase [Deltaproteobacteria bacterium]|nr:HAMP domain-containing histidine kinase [Deltaproteobacteria bacterium]